jgi:dTMP kinase
MARGVLIAFEGIDGTGKGTQAHLLARALRRAGRSVKLFSFPAYGRTLSSELIATYLNGGFGALDARLTALLFACDRLEQLRRLENALATGNVVICDRYVPSNLAHQVARAPDREKPRLRRYILNLEYRQFGLPRPDAVLFLDMSPKLARSRVLSKGHRQYTRRSLDVQEANQRHLHAALAEYRQQASGRAWHRIATIDGDGQPRSRSEIHADVVRALDRSSVIRFRNAVVARPRRKRN